MWGGTPGPQPTPTSARWNHDVSSTCESWVTRADQGVRPISVNLIIDFHSKVLLCWGMTTAEESLGSENWSILRTFLPKGWKEMARSTGALRRARDIPDAESLLRLLLMHVVNGYSLAETAVRAL